MLTDFRQALRADFARNPGALTRMTLTIWRTGQYLHGRRGLLAWAAMKAYQAADLIWVRLIIGSELPPDATAGPGVRLYHGGRGIVLSAQARIGENVSIFHQVTCGVRGNSTAPVICDDVEIGVGAKVLGAISVGPGVRIGAGAVVIHDVPAGRVAVGVPAVVKERLPSY